MSKVSLEERIGVISASVQAYANRVEGKGESDEEKVCFCNFVIVCDDARYK